MSIKNIHIGLLPQILLAIFLGIALGGVLPMWAMRLFATFNGVFSQFISFLVPLLILGFVTPAIAGIGGKAGYLLLATVGISYIDTVLSGVMSYFISSATFPNLIGTANSAGALAAQASDLNPFFTITSAPTLVVMTALVLSFMVGISVAMFNLDKMKGLLDEFRIIIDKTLRGAMIPLLPLYIFGLFLNMTQSGQVWTILTAFAQIIIIIFAMHIALLMLQFIVAGAITGRNPFKALYNMLPAYFTALGTASSAATIPVTIRSMHKNDIDDHVSGFVAPLCATIHMSGSEMKITACAVALMIIQGMPFNTMLFIGFCAMLAIFMIAGPGVPGGAIMAGLGVLSSILGFDGETQALMIALYIAMDSFGTACNVTGDGAIAMVINKLYIKEDKKLKSLVNE